MRAPHLPRMVRPGVCSPRRLAVAAAVGVMATLACQPLASAHVSVSPDTIEPGESATISFRVPNEREDATTTRLEVDVPADVGSVSPQVMPGWHVATQKSGEKVTSIVWDGSIPADTFASFTVRIGKLPETGTLSFKALQTYSDGQVVRWIDLQEPGQAEPEHPAPTVTIAKAAPAAESTSDSDATARVLGGAGLVAGLAAAGLALTRRRPAPAKTQAPPREKARL